MFYSNYPITLYFRFEFFRISSTSYERKEIKNSIKNKRKKSAMTRKCHDNRKLQIKKIDMEKIKKNKNELKEHIREIKTKQKEKLLIDLKSFTNK